MHLRLLQTAALIYNSGLPVRALFSMVLGPDESFEEK